MLAVITGCNVGKNKQYINSRLNIIFCLQKRSPTLNRYIKQTTTCHGEKGHIFKPTVTIQTPSEVQEETTTIHSRSTFNQYQKNIQIDSSSNIELYLESTKKLVASLINQTLKPKSNKESNTDPDNNIKQQADAEVAGDEIPCKDIETIFASKTFVDNSDVDVEIQTFPNPTQILHFTGHHEITACIQNVKPKPTTSHVPALSREAFKLPHPSTAGTNVLSVIAIGGFENGRQFVHRFIPSTNCWDVLTVLPEPRHHQAITAMQHILYVAGGLDVNTMVRFLRIIKSYTIHIHAICLIETKRQFMVF